MRVLHSNKFNHLVGGADKYFLDLVELLSKRGVDTAKFSMAHPDNRPDRHERFFVSQIDFNNFKLRHAYKYAGRVIYSREAAHKFEQLVKDFRPDLVHLHNIYHQLSPSILPIAKKYSLPVIMHLHDYKYLCPNYKMYNSSGLCERCRGGKYYNCARYKCLKNSRAKSALAALEMYIHHRLFDIYDRNVDLFIAPSEFMKNKFIEWGGNPDKVKVLPYFVKTDEFAPNYAPGDYLLYMGRLSEEKGIGTLIKAFKRLSDTHPEVKLIIVGDGPEASSTKSALRSFNLENHVQLLGPKYGEELNEIVKNSLAAVVPSEWYEVSGIVIIEANASGKPVIGSRIGGIVENIEDNFTGLLFTPGRSDELAQKMERLYSQPELAEKMGRQGRDRSLSKHNPGAHLNNIIGIYESFQRGVINK